MSARLFPSNPSALSSFYRITFQTEDGSEEYFDTRDDPMHAVMWRLPQDTVSYRVSIVEKEESPRPNTTHIRMYKP